MADPNSVKPSLDNARERILRAEEHILDIERIVKAVPLDKNAPVVATQNDAGVYVASFTVRNQRVPAMVAIRIGETIYNLRAALDYLIYEMSILDSGKPANRSQFPLESTKDGWKMHQASWMTGVNAIHKAAIELYQPYNGIAWTATLRDLSNPDKHRSLVFATHGVRVTVEGSAVLKVQADGVFFKNPVEVKYEATPTVLFADRSLVTQTLEKLKASVSDVIAAFDPDF